MLGEKDDSVLPNFLIFFNLRLRERGWTHESTPAHKSGVLGLWFPCEPHKSLKATNSSLQQGLAFILMQHPGPLILMRFPGRNMLINLSSELMELGRRGELFHLPNLSSLPTSSTLRSLWATLHSQSRGRALQVDSPPSKMSSFSPAGLELMFLFQSLCTEKAKN